MSYRIARKEMIILCSAQANKRLMSLCMKGVTSMHIEPRLLLSVRNHDAWSISRPPKLSPRRPDFSRWVQPCLRHLCEPGVLAR